MLWYNMFITNISKNNSDVLNDLDNNDYKYFLKSIFVIFIIGSLLLVIHLIILIKNNKVESIFKNLLFSLLFSLLFVIFLLYICGMKDEIMFMSTVLQIIFIFLSIIFFSLLIHFIYWQYFKKNKDQNWLGKNNGHLTLLNNKKKPTDIIKEWLDNNKNPLKEKIFSLFYHITGDQINNKELFKINNKESFSTQIDKFYRFLYNYTANNILFNSEKVHVFTDIFINNYNKLIISLVNDFFINKTEDRKSDNYDLYDNTINHLNNNLSLNMNLITYKVDNNILSNNLINYNLDNNILNNNLNQSQFLNFINDKLKRLNSSYNLSKTRQSKLNAFNTFREYLNDFHQYLLFDLFCLDIKVKTFKYETESFNS